MARIDKLTVLGVGLIGGSLARALRRTNEVGEIVGYGRDAAKLSCGVELGVIDRGTCDLRDAVAGADVVVVAVTLGATERLLAALAPVVDPETIITDVGSVKQSVIADARRLLGAGFRRFVPGHPIAGTERSGVEASFAELYDRQRIILTPCADTDPLALEVVRAMWRQAGAAEVIDMDPAHHDEVLAATSHVPHVLAYALVDCLAAMEDRIEIFKYAAGGFADFTRIASSDPDMWHDVTMANRDAIFKVLTQYETTARAIATALAAGDSEGLKNLFRRAKDARDRFVDRRVRH